jgi:triosephosphate isomerase (TIM)
MKLPVIIVNFKVYQQAVGERAVELAKVHEKVAMETGANIAICVNALDLEKVIEAVSIPVFAQHIDPVSFGSNTGSILPEMVKEMGAFGTLLNHAERQVDDEILRDSIYQAKQVGLFTVVCANTPGRGQEIVEMEADLVAVEPPELIGGDISVAKAKPEIVQRAVELIGEGRTLVGAGVKDSEDVKISLSFGASGVLLASGVTKAEDPYAVLKDLVSGLE